MFGSTSGINNTYKDLWEGPTATYVFPTVGQQMKVVSTSANDAAAGTGARSVAIEYLDSNYVMREETITLNGVTPVNTVATDIFRVNMMHVLTVGSGLVSAGNISLTNTAGSVTYDIVTAGNNITKSGVYTVPAGFTGYISHWQASSGSSGNHFCPIEILATCHNGVRIPDVMCTQDIMGTQNNGVSINFPTPIPIPEKVDVRIRGISDNAAAGVVAVAAIMGWFDDNRMP